MLRRSALMRLCVPCIDEFGKLSPDREKNLALYLKRKMHTIERSTRLVFSLFQLVSTI
jgi:hypothetical protein